MQSPLSARTGVLAAVEAAVEAFEEIQIGALYGLVLFELAFSLVYGEPFAHAAELDMLFPFGELLINHEKVHIGPVFSFFVLEGYKC